MHRHRRAAVWFLAACVCLSTLLHLAPPAVEWWLEHRTPEHEQDDDVIEATTKALKSQTLADHTNTHPDAHDGEFTVTLGVPAPASLPPQPPTHTQAKPHLAKYKALTQALTKATPPTPVAATADTPELAVELPPDVPAATAVAEPPPLPVTQPAEEATPPAFPDQVDIRYVLKGIVDVDHRWRIQGKQYEITTSGGMFGRYYEWKSTGQLSKDGLIPHSFTEWRDHVPSPKYQVDFDWPAQTVKVGEPGSQKDFELIKGAQDMFSAAYQFAIQGESLPTFTMQIVSGRNSYVVPFELKGEVKIWLAGEQVSTLLLSGQWKTIKFSFYLAPAWHNLPVRILREDENGSIDLRARRIDIQGKRVLDPNFASQTTP
ncbi:DUF3108 domain-containing protein [Burkholderiaceae bacterium DAT-1]|nr:DUF3108 domain-containing protein [Burkholderiaceae bacterium DAT-1]